MPTSMDDIATVIAGYAGCAATDTAAIDSFMETALANLSDEVKEEIFQRLLSAGEQDGGETVPEPVSHESLQITPLSFQKTQEEMWVAMVMTTGEGSARLCQVVGVTALAKRNNDKVDLFVNHDAVGRWLNRGVSVDSETLNVLTCGVDATEDDLCGMIHGVLRHRLVDISDRSNNYLFEMLFDMANYRWIDISDRSNRKRLIDGSSSRKLTA